MLTIWRHNFYKRWISKFFSLNENIVYSNNSNATWIEMIDIIVFYIIFIYFLLVFGMNSFITHFKYLKNIKFNFKEKTIYIFKFTCRNLTFQNMILGLNVRLRTNPNMIFYTFIISFYLELFVKKGFWNKNTKFF